MATWNNPPTVPETQFLDELVPEFLQVVVIAPISIALEAALFAALLWLWGRLRGTYLKMGWLFMVGILSQVPRVIEEPLRIFLLLLSPTPYGVPSHVSFAPLFGIDSGPVVTLLIHDKHGC